MIRLYYMAIYYWQLSASLHIVIDDVWAYNNRCYCPHQMESVMTYYSKNIAYLPLTSSPGKNFSCA